MWINMGEVGVREGGKSPCEEGLFQKEKQAKPLSTMNQINFHIGFPKIFLTPNQFSNLFLK